MNTFSKVARRSGALLSSAHHPSAQRWSGLGDALNRQAAPNGLRKQSMASTSTTQQQPRPQQHQSSIIEELGQHAPPPQQPQQPQQLQPAQQPQQLQPVQQPQQLQPVQQPQQLQPAQQPPPFLTVPSTAEPAPAMGMLGDALCPERPLVFDSHQLVTYLNVHGIPMAQSEAITRAIVRISQQSSKYHSEQLITKSEFAELKSELSILEKADFALLKTEINSIEKRLETSVAEIYTNVERVENRIIKWIVAVSGAVVLGILRMMSGGSSSSSDHRLAVPRPPTNVVSQQQDQAFSLGGSRERHKTHKTDMIET